MTSAINDIITLAERFDAELPPLEIRSLPGLHNLNRLIDHTLLKPDAVPSQIDRLCDEALRKAFAAVCVNPVFVPQAARRLSGSPVAVCTVVGFPLGATATHVKATETDWCVEHGATEIDTVIAIGQMKAGELQAVYDDIAAVVAAAHRQGALVKVILEMAYLTRREKILACLLSQACGAEFVKTSTGFAPSGARVDDVALMRRVIGPQMGLKAAGGIRSLADAQAMLAAGATRLGSSAGVKIMSEAAAQLGAASERVTS